MSAAHTVGGLLLGAALAITPLTAQATPAGDPPCGYDVHAGKLTVTSLSVKGRVRVWLGDRLVRDGRHIHPGETETYRLKHRHTSSDFTVSIVRGPLTENEGNPANVSHCEQA